MSDEQMSRDEAAEVIADILECTPNLRECDEAALRVALAAIAALGGVEALTEAERTAIEGVMANAEHEGYDTDDACPDIDEDEDAYWAWNTYHGLRKLLPAPPSKEG